MKAQKIVNCLQTSSVAKQAFSVMDVWTSLSLKEVKMAPASM
jgi:hypothetical protein